MAVASSVSWCVGWLPARSAPIGGPVSEQDRQAAMSPTPPWNQPKSGRTGTAMMTSTTPRVSGTARRPGMAIHGRGGALPWRGVARRDGVAGTGGDHTVAVRDEARRAPAGRVARG
jgi:hypothetical protein